MSVTPGAPIWVDFTSPDLPAMQAFYSTVLGWEYTEPTEQSGGYVNATVDGQAVAGLSPVMEGWPASTAWTVYLATDDIQATHEKVLAAGGQADLEPMQVGPFGWMAIWRDPTGCSFGGWQGAEHAGFEIRDVPGAVCWNDVATPDFAAAKAFYTEVFGWTYVDHLDSEEFKYAMFVPPGAQQPAGGIGGADPSGQFPVGWGTAFQVPDVDAALPDVQRAGGTVLGEPMDFEFGRIVNVRAPGGEFIALFTGTS